MCGLQVELVGMLDVVHMVVDSYFNVAFFSLMGRDEKIIHLVCVNWFGTSNFVDVVEALDGIS